MKQAASTTPSQSSTIVGVHIIAEMTGCSADLLNDEAFLIDLVERSARAGGATVLSTNAHSFEPQGVTVVSLLSESHMTIHTWPENNYAAVDIFTCGTSCTPETSVKLMADALGATNVLHKKLQRGNHGN